MSVEDYRWTEANITQTKNPFKKLTNLNSNAHRTRGVCSEYIHVVFLDQHPAGSAEGSIRVARLRAMLAFHFFENLFRRKRARLDPEFR